MSTQTDEGSAGDVHGMLREAAQRFVERECSREVVAKLEESGTGYSPDHWRRMAELGWLGLLQAEEYGGAGLGVTELGLVVDLLGGSALQSPLFPTAIEAATLIALAGSDEQKAHWLPQIADGAAILAVALQEPGDELALEDLRTRATATGAGFRLEGEKLFVPYVEAASQLVVVARTGDAADALGLFLVPPAAAGIQLTRLRTSNNDPLYAVRFEGVEVPASAVLGALNGGLPHLMAMLERAAALKCAELVGLGRRALELTLQFARDRVQFGQPIGKFQAVQHHCADMYRDLEQARILMAQALWRLDGGKSASREVSMAKIKASEAIPSVLRMAHQIHGGVGFYADYPLESLYRRSIAAQSAYGSATWHRRKLSQLLRDDPKRFRRDDAHPLAH